MSLSLFISLSSHMCLSLLYVSQEEKQSRCKSAIVVKFCGPNVFELTSLVRIFRKKIFLTIWFLNQLTNFTCNHFRWDGTRQSSKTKIWRCLPPYQNLGAQRDRNVELDDISRERFVVGTGFREGLAGLFLWLSSVSLSLLICLVAVPVSVSRCLCPVVCVPCCVVVRCVLAHDLRLLCHHALACACGSDRCFSMIVVTRTA